MRIVFLSTLGAAGMLLALAGATAMEPARSPDASPDAVVATWREAEIGFTYIGRTSFYTCDSLRDKVTRILLSVGAREDLVVREIGCFGREIDRFTRVRIKMAVPEVAAPGGLEPQERNRRELVSRVRGETPSAAEIEGRFPARWETVKFSGRDRVVEDGDCELLEQMNYGVFKPLGLEVPHGKIRCIPGEIRMGQVNFDMKVLKALPKPDDATR